MTDTAALFTDAVDHYVQHRLAYPTDLIDGLIARFGIGPGTKVIDVGCGPGLLAVPFARTGAEVLAIDPNEPMLEAGRTAARMAALRIEFQVRKAEDLDAADGLARLVAFGRSFHWTDRARVLSLLEEVVEPDGGVVVIHEDRDQKADTPTGQVIEAMKRDWIPDDLHRRSRAGHQDILAASPFCKVERLTGSVPRVWTADQVLGQMLSTSYFNPGRLGDRRAAFEADLRARLARLAPDGVFEEALGFLALVATRPAG
ncbi:MAG: class I SAM-dependent methyltransferase [Alphaproteobacteria bacterium]|nr:class I SAM-dependent methyltransferase [Alphaproteobacteria bacterium]